MLFALGPKELRDEPPPRGPNQTERDVATYVLIQRDDVRRHRGDFTEDATRPRDNHFTGVGESTAGTVNKFGTHLRLQPSDAARDIGLDGVERERRERERSVVGDRDKGLELLDIHKYLENRLHVSMKTACVIQINAPYLSQSPQSEPPPEATQTVSQRDRPPPWSIPLLFLGVVSVVAMVAPLDHLGFRARVAVAGLRFVNWTSRRAGRGSGTVVGGRVGLLLNPHLLEHLLAGRDVILISGTNGKTTTTALVRAALGGSSASNLTGSNMPEGIVAALADNRTSTCVLEVDEPWLGVVMDAATSARRRCVLLLNLSRDQLDRSSEVRQLAERWRMLFVDPSRSNLWTVIANVNDPLVAYAVSPAPHLIACSVPSEWTGDAVSCPVCTTPLAMKSDASGAVGEGWHCTCGFSRPEPSVTLSDHLVMDGRDVPLTISLPGAFNRSNAALALVAATWWGTPITTATAGLAEVREVAGRFAVRSWNGRRWRLMLAKNPAGFAALLPLVAHAGGDLVVSINANVADGRDPAWLYDAPFEILRGRRVWCTGDRALDLAARLDYAGVEFVVARESADFPTGVAATEPIDVIANYTAFAQWQSSSTPC